MAVNDITSSAGPFTGNGVTTVFPFDFAAFDESEVAVTVNSASVVSGYSVSLTFDVNGSPTGGNVTFGAAPANGAIIMLLSNPDFTQTTMFTRYGPYFPDFVNRPLDRAAVRAIYLRGIAARAVTVPIGQAGFTLPSTIDSAALVTLASIAPAISAVAANATNITVVAGIAANITTVAGLAANITVVAGIAANITAVAGNAANITAVAGNAANVTTVAGIAANVTAVAGNAVNITAVATDLALGAGASFILRAPQAAIDAVAAAAAAAGSAAATIIPLYASSVKSAVGAGTLKALFDMDGPRTAYSGSPTILTALTSLDDTPLTLSVFSSIYSGANPRPFYDARGIFMGAQAGLQTTAPIFSKTSGDFAFLYAVDFNTVTSTVALQASLPGSPADGDMVLVNGDRNVVPAYGTDVKTVLDTQWTSADLVNGYFKWNSSGAAWERFFYLFKATGPSGSRFECSISHLGQIFLFIYDGTNQVTLFSKGNVLMGQSKALIAFRRRGNTIYVVVNGKTIFGIGSTSLPNVTDLNQWYFNGSSRTANTVQPINNGMRHYLKGLVVADDLTVDCFHNLHDIVARRHGTPAIVRPHAARGIVVFGQSWTDATTAVSDLWRAGPNSWDGQVRANNATYAQEANSVTREAFPNVFVNRDRDNPWDIAPYAVQVDPSGNVGNATSHAFGATGENFAAGFAKQLNAHSQGAATDWIVSGFGSGGATIATLSFQSVVPLVQQLKSVTLASNDYYNKVLREIVYARDFANLKGQTYTVDLFVWQQGHSDTNNAAYLTALYALYDRFVIDIQAITGQSHKPIMIMPQINYSADGVVNSSNNGAGVIDQLFLDMEEGGRGTRPMYCVGPMYPVTNFIHPYRAGHRWIGEIFGRAATQILFDGEGYGSLHPYAYTMGANYVDIDYRVRPGRALTLSQTNDNNIYQVATNQGFDFTDVSAGGVTITGVTATSATRIRVALSGAPAAGDIIRYAGSQRFGNVADGAKVNGLYPDQDWTATFVSNEPPFGNGNLNDLRQWACASRKVL